MRSNENAKNEITKWTRFIIPLRYRKCRIIRAIVTLAGIRVGQFMSEWLWIISAVGRIKLWYYISSSELSHRPSSHSTSSLSRSIPCKLHSLVTDIFLRANLHFYLFSPLESILCQHVNKTQKKKKKHACKAINEELNTNANNTLVIHHCSHTHIYVYRRSIRMTWEVD